MGETAGGDEQSDRQSRELGCRKGRKARSLDELGGKKDSGEEIG